MAVKKIKNKKYVLAFSLLLTILLMLTGRFLLNNQKRTIQQTASTDKITEQAKKEQLLTQDTREPLEITANQQAVITNEDGKTPSEKRGAVKTNHTATQEEIDEAAKTGEHKQKVFDITLDSGVKISEKDIANTRDTLRKAGLNEEYYSDYDIALVIKAASDKSLDVVTIIENDEWSDIDE